MLLVVTSASLAQSSSHQDVVAMCASRKASTAAKQAVAVEQASETSLKSEISLGFGRMPSGNAPPPQDAWEVSNRTLSLKQQGLSASQIDRVLKEDSDQHRRIFALTGRHRELLGKLVDSCSAKLSLAERNGSMLNLHEIFAQDAIFTAALVKERAKITAESRVASELERKRLAEAEAKEVARDAWLFKK